MAEETATQKVDFIAEYCREKEAYNKQKLADLYNPGPLATPDEIAEFLQPTRWHDADDPPPQVKKALDEEWERLLKEMDKKLMDFKDGEIEEEKEKEQAGEQEQGAGKKAKSYVHCAIQMSRMCTPLTAWIVPLQTRIRHPHNRIAISFPILLQLRSDLPLGEEFSCDNILDFAVHLSMIFLHNIT